MTFRLPKRATSLFPNDRLAELSISNDGVSFQAEALTKLSRPDFSSTSEDEAEEILFEEPKLLLKSDINHSSHH